MNTPVIAVDHRGRCWALLPGSGGALRARFVSASSGAGDPPRAVVDVAVLIADAGPLTLAAQPDLGSGTVSQLLDTVTLVAEDPETASIEQIRATARLAQSVLTSGPSRGRRRWSA